MTEISTTNRRLHIFQGTYGTLIKIDQILRHGKSLNFKGIQVIQSTFSGHKGVKLKIIKKDNWKISKCVKKKKKRISNNPWVKDKIKRKIRKYCKLNENKNKTSEFVGCYLKAPLGENL